MPSPRISRTDEDKMIISLQIIKSNNSKPNSKNWAVKSLSTICTKMRGHFLLYRSGAPII